MNKKYILIGILIFVFLVISFFIFCIATKNNQPQSLQKSSEIIEQQDINNSDGKTHQIVEIFNSKGEKFAYVNNFKIYLYNILSNNQSYVPLDYNVRDLCRKDENTIYYTSNYEYSNIYFYNFRENKGGIIKDLNGYNPTFLSSDCKYVYTDEGTGPGCRGSRVFDLEKDQFIDAIGGRPIWNPSKTRYVYGECGLYDDIEYFTGELGKNNNKLFFTAKDDKWIEDIKWIDDSNFYYSVNNQYFKFDFNSGKSLSVSADEVGEFFSTNQIISPSGKYKIDVNNLVISTIDGSQTKTLGYSSGLRGSNGAVWIGGDGQDNLGEISQSSAWNGLEDCGKYSSEMWVNCNQECFYKNIQQCGASQEVLSFSKLFSEEAYLKEFKEMGKVDLGIISFPNRPDIKEEYCLLNGKPSLILPIIYEEFLSEETQISYQQMKGLYKKALLSGRNPDFIRKDDLSNGEERYIFRYKFMDSGYYTKYSADIGFDFSSDGTFLRTTFLQITR